MARLYASEEHSAVNAPSAARTDPLSAHPANSGPRRFGFYEFFAGGGLARLGLGPDWRCLLANDIDPAKAAAYRANWGGADLIEGDVGRLRSTDLPGRADLAWASFPCQDLSLAGAGEGLSAPRSGAFWPFHALMAALVAEGRAPRVIVLENVIGLAARRKGADLATIWAALGALGYRVGALRLDAADFLPQSRPRLFIVASAVPPPGDLAAAAPPPAWLAAAWARLSPEAAARSVIWRLPPPLGRRMRLADVIEPESPALPWRSAAETERLLELMSPLQRTRIAEIQAANRLVYGTAFRRTRPDAAGHRVQRAEARFDDCAGCLRTPAGGSSRQILLRVAGAAISSRFLSGREAARLMGVPDSYRLPANERTALHLMGDAVAAPVVAHLARHLLAPLLAAG